MGFGESAVEFEGRQDKDEQGRLGAWDARCRRARPAWVSGGRSRVTPRGRPGGGRRGGAGRGGAGPAGGGWPYR
jgi:hypothetical protein